MTTEREEFEEMIRDATDGRLNEINEEYREEFKPINVIWSWHQQSLERAVEKERERIKEIIKKNWTMVQSPIGDFEVIDPKVLDELDSLTPPQLDKLSIKK